MIHVFAIEPDLVASWGGHYAYEFIRTSFGLGTPRVMLELPVFKTWRRLTWDAAMARGLPEMEKKRIEALLMFFSEHKCGRRGMAYNGESRWLPNAEGEYARKPYAGILASSNPRGHGAVLTSERLSQAEPRWACVSGATPARTAESVAGLLKPMLVDCRVLHLVDPYFDPGKPVYRDLLAELMKVCAKHNPELGVLRVHCSDKLSLHQFELQSAAMARRLPASTSPTVEFIRWRQRPGSDKIHNRYVLTDLGGVKFGIGLDEGDDGETDDVEVMHVDQYRLRWRQYVEDDGTFEHVDAPASVRGSLPNPN